MVIPSVQFILKAGVYVLHCIINSKLLAPSRMIKDILSEDEHHPTAFQIYHEGKETV